MKKEVIAILFVILSLVACGSDSSEELQPQETEMANDSIPTLEGEFIFLSDAAVFKGKDFVYGVSIDSVSRALAEEVEAYKEDQFDMIPVKLKAKIIQNPGRQGWDEIIEIREVLSISVPKEEPEESSLN